MKTRKLHSTACLLAGISAVALTTPAFAETEQEQENTIVVTGLRASLQDAVQKKRNSTEVVDSITADDIGKLPDPNVAETLTRVPGVQAYRFGGEAASPVGEGSGLTIRGLSNLTASRVDGRQFFTAGSREYNIESAIPGIVAGLDVYKNPAAEHIEGAIGGLVDIRTRKPLDFSDPLVVSAGATVRYNDFAGKARPEYFGLVSTRFETAGGAELGILIAANYQQSVNRGDNLPGNGGANLRRPIFADSAEYAADASLDQSYAGRSDIAYLQRVSNDEALALSDAERQNLVSDITNNFWTFAEEYERTRKGLNVALQFKPSSNLEFNVSGLYNSYLYDQDYRFIISPNSSYIQGMTTTPFEITEGLADRNANGGTDETLAYNRIASGTRLGSSLFTLGGREKRLYETGIIAGNMRWNATDRLTLAVDASYVKADQRRRNYNVRMNTAAGVTVDLFRDTTSSPFQYDVGGTIDLQDPNDFVFHSFNQDANNILDDKGYALRLDGEYELGDAGITKIKVGGRWARLQSTYRDFRRGYSLGGVSAADYQDLLGFGPSDFYDGQTGFGGNFLVFDPEHLFEDVISSRFPDANIPPLDAYAENQLNRRFFKEDTYAGYVQADYELMDGRLRGNAGVRVVKTDTFARAQVTFTPDTGAPFIAAREDNSGYTNILPSFNAVYELAPDTLLRFGYGKGMTRPTVAALNPTITVNPSTGTGSQGNPDLRAQTADSLDLSLEHYFANGGYVSVNGFYKWIDGFFAGIEECQTVDVAPAFPGVSNGCSNGQYRITRTVNAEKGTVKGVEIAAQTFFDFDFLPKALHHFGAAGSFTYVDSSMPITFGNGVTAKLPQPFVSKYSYSLSGFYEDELFQARLVYTWRDDAILFGASQNPIDGRYFGAYGLLDASISVEPVENLTFSITASNLTNAAPDRYVGEPGQYATGLVRQPFLNGRVFGASVRYRFGS